jgi:hypothetical protein
MVAERLRREDQEGGRMLHLVEGMGSLAKFLMVERVEVESILFLQQLVWTT